MSLEVVKGFGKFEVDVALIDGEYVGTCVLFPGLSTKAVDAETALEDIKQAIKTTVCRQCRKKPKQEPRSMCVDCIDQNQRDKEEQERRAAEAQREREEQREALWAECSRLNEAKRALGCPVFVVPDDDSAPAEVVRWASMPGAERARRISDLLGSNDQFVYLFPLVDGGIRRSWDACSVKPIPLSVWRWIQATATRCIANGEPVYVGPKSNHQSQSTQEGSDK